jgi:2-keto-4-pentenoate hydratase/2-oxohepta-3-ene-1,7-dioic acid hydratase in catechol pathway
VKLISFTRHNRSSFGVVADGHVLDLGPSKQFGSCVKELLRGDWVAALRATDISTLPRIPLGEVLFEPVIPSPDKILCIGINYASHLKETGREAPSHPMVFTRFADSQVGHGRPIIRPALSIKLDFEGELAVVIGRPAHRVTAADALNYVAGYSCYNDGSVRDWQRHTIQFTPGKNFPMTGGFGPWLVTTDEIPDPSTLHLTTRLNGQVMQDAPISDMVFGVERLIEYCSAFTPLSAGDVIVTGTTGGVGAFRQPPVWMKPGDIVEVEISDIGVLRNQVADESN